MYWEAQEGTRLPANGLPLNGGKVQPKEGTVGWCSFVLRGRGERATVSCFSCVPRWKRGGCLGDVWRKGGRNRAIGCVSFQRKPKRGKREKGH